MGNHASVTIYWSDMSETSRMTFENISLADFDNKIKLLKDEYHEITMQTLLDEITYRNNDVMEVEYHEVKKDKSNHFKMIRYTCFYFNQDILDSLAELDIELQIS